MTIYDQVLKVTADKTRQSIPVNENDYIDNESGLLICGECHTPKETMVPMFGRQTKVRCMCKCMSLDYKAKEEAEAKRQKRLLMKEMREEAFPTSTLAGCTFEEDKMPECDLSKVSRNYVKHFPELLEKGRGLVFFGRAGTGKTFYSCCIANALLDKEYSVIVTSFSRIANTLFGLKGDIQGYLDRLDKYDLLVIDDYSVERTSEYMMETVFSVIDNRVKCGRPMIVTTNLAKEQMKDQMHTAVDRTRILSRLFEVCTFFEAKGEDLRMRFMREEDGKYRNMLMEEEDDTERI